MNTQAIEEIAEKSAARLKELILENEEEILKLIHGTVEQAQDREEETKKEQPLKIKLTHAIVLDLVKMEILNKLGWTTAYSSEIKERLTDPNQAELFQ